MLNAQSLSNCSFRAGDDSPDVRLFDDIVSGPITTVVVMLGVIGNAKSIKLLTHTRINVKMASSLIALAIWDIVLLVSSLGYYSLAASTHLFLRANWPFNRTAVFLHGVFALANTISTWLLIEVTVRRFVAVARPLDWTTKALVGKGTKRSRWKKTKTICAAARMPLILTFAAFIVNFPVSFELEVEDCLDVAAMTISQQIAPSALRLHPLYKVYYRAILSAALKTLGPFVLISGLTVAMVVGMRRSFARRKDILDEQHQSSLCESDEDKKQTLQWISTILLCKFMVFRCWPIILDVWEAATLPSQRQHMSLFAYLVSASKLLVLFNSASNCFIFVFVKLAFETRRIRRTRYSHILRFVQHADQFFLISRRMAGDAPNQVDDTISIAQSVV